MRLGVNFFDERETLTKLAKKVVYTGKIDEYYNYRFGELEYRSLDFKHEILPGDYQGVAGVNYTSENVPWTRKIEHKHFEFLTTDKTVVTTETPVAYEKGRVPYYPINDVENNKRYQMYKTLADIDNKVIMGGRLATYTYLNMDQVINQALRTAEKELK